MLLHNVAHDPRIVIQCAVMEGRLHHAPMAQMHRFFVR
jgi:hypothetical protein